MELHACSVYGAIGQMQCLQYSVRAVPLYFDTWIHCNLSGWLSDVWKSTAVGTVSLYEISRRVNLRNALYTHVKSINTSLSVNAQGKGSTFTYFEVVKNKRKPLIVRLYPPLPVSLPRFNLLRVLVGVTVHSSTLAPWYLLSEPGKIVGRNGSTMKNNRKEFNGHFITTCKEYNEMITVFIWHISEYGLSCDMMEASGDCLHNPIAPLRLETRKREKTSYMTIGSMFIIARNCSFLLTLFHKCITLSDIPNCLSTKNIVFLEHLNSEMQVILANMNNTKAHRAYFPKAHGLNFIIKKRCTFSRGDKILDFCISLD